jgi:hypothetical protein
MGAWGLGLFQSDSDLDLICEIEAVAQGYLPPNSSLENPENRDAVRDALDGGAPAQILAHSTGSPTAAVYTLVMAMQVGSKISDEQRKTLGKQAKKGAFTTSRSSRSRGPSRTTTTMERPGSSTASG